MKTPRKKYTCRLPLETIAAIKVHADTSSCSEADAIIAAFNSFGVCSMLRNFAPPDCKDSNSQLYEKHKSFLAENPYGIGKDGKPNAKPIDYKMTPIISSSAPAVVPSGSIFFPETPSLPNGRSSALPAVIKKVSDFPKSLSERKPILRPSGRL